MAAPVRFFAWFSVLEYSLGYYSHGLLNAPYLTLLLTETNLINFPKGFNCHRDIKHDL